jgi:hypothetical protein
LQLFFFLQFSTWTFIEIYRFIDRNFSKKTINFAFIVLSIFFEKDTLYKSATCIAWYIEIIAVFEFPASIFPFGVNRAHSKVSLDTRTTRAL